jgi:dTDP-4-amino-4,6-dideoxygalactose transaminase
MEPILEVAQAHDIPVIEDAAQAIGAKRNGKPACAWGRAGCLSFYPSKNLGAFGDAGAICTNDDRFAQDCRMLRVHGSGHTYYHKMVGGMFRIAAIQAAVLSVKLKYLDRWHDGRRRNAALYDELFAKCDAVKTPLIEHGNWSIYNQYVIRVRDRDRVKQRLADRGIGTAVYYPLGLHLQECFRDLGYREGDLPETERASREVLALPIYPELTEVQIHHVAREVLAAAQ